MNKERMMSGNIIGVISNIRGCVGIMIPMQSNIVNINEVMNLIDDICNDSDYHVYGLRYFDNDWSEPYWIEERHCYTNRYGWFITKDNMDFHKDNKSLRIRMNNTKYFGCKIKTSGIIIDEKALVTIYSISFDNYLKYEDFIITSVRSK